MSPRGAPLTQGFVRELAAGPGCLIVCGRFEGVETALGRLYAAARLYVNFFQPSMKLKEKRREGTHVRRSYTPAQTPFERLCATTLVAVTANDKAGTKSTTGSRFSKSTPLAAMILL